MSSIYPARLRWIVVAICLLAAMVFITIVAIRGGGNHAEPADSSAVSR